MRNTFIFLLTSVLGNFIVNAATIVKTLADEGNFETLLNVAKLAKLGKKTTIAKVLDGASGFTLFAPSDAAFDEIAKFVPYLTESTKYSNQLLTEVLLTHTLSQTVTAENVTKEKWMTLLDEQSLKVNKVNNNNDDEFVINTGFPNLKSTITKADIEADTNYIHEINKVLLPKTFPIDTIGDIVNTGASPSSGYKLTILKNILEELDITLTSAGPAYTVFAPSDEAWENFFNKYEVSLDLILNDTKLKKKLRQIVYLHVAGNVYFSDSLPRNIPTIGGRAIKRTEVKPIETDLKTLNGVIHPVEVVIEQKVCGKSFGGLVKQAKKKLDTVVSIAVSQPKSFGDLVKFIKKADKESVLIPLSNPANELTVFAPTNDAFDKVKSVTKYLQNKSPYSEELLTSLLEYHVVSGKFLSTQLLNKNSIVTLNGESLSLDINNLMVGNSKIAQANVEAGTNAIIHVLDDVLIPGNFPTKNIAELGIADTDFTVLVKILVETGLVNLFNSPKGRIYTVFAPTDTAFTNILTVLGGVELDTILENKKAKKVLVDIVKLHIVKGDRTSDEIGSKIRVLYKNSKIDTNTIEFSNQLNLGALNGIVHKINNVITIQPLVNKLVAALAN